jgi:hypothetical protein
MFLARNPCTTIIAGKNIRADQSRVRESNPRPHDYKSSALPTELTRRIEQATDPAA